MLTVVIIALVAAAIMFAVGMVMTISALVSVALAVGVVALILGIIFKLARKVLGCSSAVVLLMAIAFVWFMFLR